MPLKICVLGAGRVGSVVAAAFLRSGANVYISDIDSGKIERIKSGKPILEDEPSRDATAEADTVVVAVPVGLKNGKPDFSSLTLAADDIAASLVKGSLVVLET